MSSFQSNSSVFNTTTMWDFLYLQNQPADSLKDMATLLGNLKKPFSGSCSLGSLPSHSNHVIKTIKGERCVWELGPLTGDVIPSYMLHYCADSLLSLRRGGAPKPPNREKKNTHTCLLSNFSTTDSTVLHTWQILLNIIFIKYALNSCSKYLKRYYFYSWKLI